MTPCGGPFRHGRTWPACGPFTPSVSRRLAHPVSPRLLARVFAWTSPTAPQSGAMAGGLRPEGLRRRSKARSSRARRSWFPLARIDQVSRLLPHLGSGPFSVPVRWSTLSGPLRILGLVGHYLHQLPNPGAAHRRAGTTLAGGSLFSRNVVPRTNGRLR